MTVTQNKAFVLKVPQTPQNIYILNQLSNYRMLIKLNLTTLYLINKDVLRWINK